MHSSRLDSPVSGRGLLCRGLPRWLLRATLVSLGVMAICVAYFAVAGSRMAFLRGATLVLDAPDASYVLQPPLEPSGDPVEAVTSIPSPPMDVPWWSPVAIVDPDALVEYTLVQGGGHCAAKSRGLAWWLEGRGIPYRLVQLFVDPGIRHGDGHVMVETTWERDEKVVVGLLDPLAAGVPMVDGVPLDSTRLIADRGGGSVAYWPDRPDLDALRLRVLHSASSADPTSASFVALSPGSEVSRHLRVMRSLSTIVPDSFAARAICMSISLFVGTYPHSYVPTQETTRVSGLLRADMWIARVLLWSARTSLACLCLLPVASCCCRRTPAHPAGTSATALR